MAFPSRNLLGSGGNLATNTRAPTEKVGSQLYVSCIPSRFNENGLANIFGKYGHVLNISYHQRDGRAFVTFSKFREAVCAMQDLHNKPPLDLKVEFAKERKDNQARKNDRRSNNTKWNKENAELPKPVSFMEDIKKPLTRLPEECNLGRGQQLASLVSKDSPRCPGIPLCESNKELLYPVIQDPSLYNPYEIDTLYTATNNILTRACVGVSSDGKRHVSKGRGYTCYTLAESDLRVPDQVGTVNEKRQAGMYVYGENKLANEVGACQNCSHPATMRCPLCRGFYCGKECQVADWLYHKSKCQPDLNESSSVLERPRSAEYLAKCETSCNAHMKYSTSVEPLPSAVNLLRLNQQGFFQAHINLNNSEVSGTICFDTMRAEFHKVMFQLPRVCETLPEDPDFKPKVGDFICGERENNDWIRGHVVSLGPPVRLAVTDEGRVEPVEKIVSIPKEFAGIPSFGATCELLDEKSQLEPWEKHLFKVTKTERSEDQEGIEVSLSACDSADASEEFEGILKPWKPAPEQKGIPYARLTSGTEICLTAYQSHDILFARSLDPQDFEMFNRIMQETAKLALYAPQVTKIPIVGQMLLAKFPKDGNFYRAIVKQIEADEITVSYVDYGNTEVVNFQNLKTISDELKQYPSCIAKVVLKDVPKGVVMTKEVNDFLSLLVGRAQPLKCTFDGGTIKDGVCLKLQNGESINEKVNMLLKPSWKRDEEEDVTVYMWSDMSVASLGEKGQTVTARVLSTMHAGVQYTLCPQDIDLVQHVAVVMTDQINEYCRATEGHYIPRVGELCLAPFQGVYYRAVCLEKKTTIKSSRVLFIDFGNTEEVAHADMKLITKDFITTESLASICRVTALGPVDEEGFLPDEVAARVEKLISPEEVVRIKIVACDHPGDYVVELPDVRATLIKEGLIEA